MQSITLTPIGTVRSTRQRVSDDNWDEEKCSIQLDESHYTAEALTSLDTFSHVEVIFYMNQVKTEQIITNARHPRNNVEWPKVGIFAQRAKNRPNQIGTSICKIVAVSGSELTVEGLDAVDGTPVLDIKPWVKEFGPRGTVHQPEWMSELMRNYW